MLTFGYVKATTAVTLTQPGRKKEELKVVTSIVKYHSMLSLDIVLCSSSFERYAFDVCPVDVILWIKDALIVPF